MTRAISWGILSQNMPRKTSNKPTLVGVMSITRRGVGYVTAEGIENDIEVAPERLGTALHRDTVEVARLLRQSHGREQGEVVRIISRAKTQFVGTLEKRGDHYFLSADDARMYKELSIPAKEITARIEKNMKVLAQMVSWDDQAKNPKGAFIRVLGPAGAHETEMEAIVLERGFEATFPKKVEDEADQIERHKAITKEEITRRRDFRNVTTFTIDPEDAKDFDDALSFQTLANGNVEIGVHIADVSHYVRPLSAIDKEAQERGTSIYLVDRTIPMLPEVLSNDVCSLNPNEDKLTYSAVFELDKQAGIVTRWFGETIIHSDKRFSYEEAQQVLTDNSGPHAEELRALNALSKILRKRREEAGAISFEQDEVKFKLDDNGKPISVFRKERLDTNMLIEDFMLLANREVAAHMHELCKKYHLGEAMFVYRIHDLPDTDKIEELAIFLRAIGYDFEVTNGEVSGQEINRLFKQIEGKPEESLIKTATIRSMAKAVYSTKNVGHFGLAFQYYTHFTSPIRRYPDVMVHRLMKNFLSKKTGQDGERLTREQFRLYERLTIQSSQREIAAVEAERDSIKYKQVEYMLDRIGQTFDGVVTGVVEWGLYVEEQKTKAEGLIRVKNLTDDYYQYKEKSYRLVGEKKKKTYTLGDRVRIKLIDAKLQDRTLEWILAE